MPSVNPKKDAKPGRGVRRAAAPLILVLTCGACTDLFAQESPAPVPPVAPPVAPPAPAAEKPADPAPAPLPQRPLDEGAIKALAAEVARLRAELAQLRDAAPADAALPDGPAAPARDLISDVPVMAPGDGGAERAGEPEWEADAEGLSEPGSERIVERVVERDVPVYVDRTIVETHVVVEQPIEIVTYYEEIHYGGSSCRQYIPHNHVHSIGCGHHYYGCACHPWYYNLDDCGISLRFTWVDDDHHDHGRPRRPGRFAAGYRNGFRDGADHHGDRHSAGFASGGRRPSDPARPLDSGTGRGSRPTLGEREPGAADTQAERPPVVSRGDGPSGQRPRPAGTASGERPRTGAATPPRAPGGAGVPPTSSTGASPGGTLGVDLRTPRDPGSRQTGTGQPGTRDPSARDGGGSTRRPSPDRTPDRATNRAPDPTPRPVNTFGDPPDRRERTPVDPRPRGTERPETPDRPRGPDRAPTRTPDPTAERPPVRVPDRPSTRDRQRGDDTPPPPAPPPRAERRSEDKGSGGKKGDGGGRRK